MALTNISANGQITLPAPIRKALGLSPGDPVDIGMDEAGRVVVTPVTITSKDFKDFDAAAQRSLAQYRETYERLADA